MKAMIQDLKDDKVKFVVDGKKHEVVEFIMTYIFQDILLHTNNFPHGVSKKLKSLFDKFDEIKVIQLEKDLFSLDLHSFERIKDYLECVKEMN
jgi:hypothetical protein